MRETKFLLRRLSPLWRGLRPIDDSKRKSFVSTPKTIPVMEGVETFCIEKSVQFWHFSPKTIPVMEGVETFCGPPFLAINFLRRLSPLWRGLRHECDPFP